MPEDDPANADDSDESVDEEIQPPSAERVARRVRDFSIRPRPYDFESLCRKAWGEPLLRYGLKLENKDLCVGGVPIEKSKRGEWQAVSSITVERHRASNWLVGYGSENFYEVTTDT